MTAFDKTWYFDCISIPYFMTSKIIDVSDWNSGKCSIEFKNKDGFIKQPFTFVLLKNFAEFTWKQLRSVTLIKKTPVQVLSCEFWEIFKNPFWQDTSERLLLDFFYSLNRHQVFPIFEHVLSRLLNVMNIRNLTSRNRRPSCSCRETDIRQDTRG